VMWSGMVSRHLELAGNSPSRTALSKARGRLPLAIWNRVFAWVSNQIQQLSGKLDKWKDLRIVLLDGTCVSMPDTPELMKEFGTCNGYHGKGRYPLARLVTMCLANSMSVISYAMGKYKDAEITLALSILDTLKKGDLLIGDRHFAGSHYYVWYLAKGIQYLTRAHQCLKVSSVKRLWSYGANDFVGKLKINPQQRRKDPSLPEYILVRFIQAPIRVRGKREVVWFATSLLDAKLYPASEIVALYAKRWKIETLFRQLKIELSADVLRSMRAEGIRKEAAARMTAINIVRTVIVEAAIQEGVRPIEVSFIYALRAIIMFVPAFATEPAWKLPDIYHGMLKDIASHLVPYRPGREEPRAVRREHHHFPTLRTTRAEWRKKYVA